MASPQVEAYIPRKDGKPGCEKILIDVPPGLGYNAAADAVQIRIEIYKLMDARDLAKMAADTEAVIEIDRQIAVLSDDVTYDVKERLAT